jgi:hypothetical protein
VVDLGGKATRKDALEQQRIMEERIKAKRREFQAQLEEFKAVAEQGSSSATNIRRGQIHQYNVGTPIERIATDAPVQCWDSDRKDSN